MSTLTIAGTSRIRVNGQLMPNRTAGKLTFNDPELEPIMGANSRLHGFKETPMPAEFETDFSLIAPLTTLNLRGATVEVQVEAPDSTVWVMSQARLVTRREFDFGEGQTTLRFVGEAVQQS